MLYTNENGTGKWRVLKDRMDMVVAELCRLSEEAYDCSQLSSGASTYTQHVVSIDNRRERQ